MIQIITRVKHQELYNRMVWSAKETASGLVMFSNVVDDGGGIKIAESYNLLGATSMADILVFCHDDIVFLSNGWDDKIREALSLGFDVVGAVGTKEYKGGMIFDSGKAHSAGRVAGIVDGERVVKLMTHRADVEPVKVVDGMFLATTREHFIKTGFDMDFDGLWFYDLDYCLRSNCAVVEILVSHEKPDHLRGVYPADLRPMSDYEPAFNAKWGFGAVQIGDQRCDTIPLAEYHKELA